MSKTCRSFPLGEEMWQRELQDHHRRLHTTKPTIRAAPPATGRPHSMGGAAAGGGRNNGRSLNSRGGAQQNGTLKASPRNGGAHSPNQKAAPGHNNHQDGDAADGNSNNAAGSSRMKLEDLTEDDREVCESMLTVLGKLSAADSKSIIEELFVAVEMRRLLAAYTGVYKDAAGEAAAVGKTKKSNNNTQKKRNSEDEDAHEAEAERPASPPKYQQRGGVTKQTKGAASPPASPKTKPKQHSNAPSPAASPQKKGTSSPAGGPLDESHRSEEPTSPQSPQSTKSAASPTKRLSSSGGADSNNNSGFAVKVDKNGISVTSNNDSKEEGQEGGSVTKETSGQHSSQHEGSQRQKTEATSDGGSAYENDFE